MADTAPAGAGLFRALRHRNYKLFFGGQGVSLIGTWLTQTAMRWLVFRLAPLDQAAALLGFVGFAGQLPTLLLAPLAGVLVDRVNRHRLLVLTQILSALQSGALAALAFGGAITIQQVVWLSVFQGMINALDMPARQAFLVDIVEDRADLPNAIALNSSMFNGARLLGPAVAGVLIGYTGEGMCFLIDTISYLAVIAALMAMTLTKKPPPSGPRANPWIEFKEGFAYGFGFPPIRTLLFLVGAIGFLTMPLVALTPIFASRLAHGEQGAVTYGLLMAASGLGALMGSIYLARRQSVLGLGRTITYSCVALGIGLMIFSQSQALWLSSLALLFVGFGMIASMAASNTILQTIVPDDKRGRVMSLFVLAFMGSAPLGSMVAGQSATRLGEELTVFLSGIFCLGLAGFFALALPKMRVHIRPIYISKGILPELATGVQSAAEVTVPPEN